jgi:hypothetical protein
MTRDEYRNAFLLGASKGAVEKAFNLALEIRRVEY